MLVLVPTDMWEICRTVKMISLHSVINFFCRSRLLKEVSTNWCNPPSNYTSGVWYSEESHISEVRYFKNHWCRSPSHSISFVGISVCTTRSFPNHVLKFCFRQNPPNVHMNTLLMRPVICYLDTSTPWRVCAHSARLNFVVINLSWFSNLVPTKVKFAHQTKHSDIFRNAIHGSSVDGESIAVG